MFVTDDPLNNLATHLDSNLVNRRSFLKILGASIALAGLDGLGGCTFFTAEGIVPYVNQPEHIIPGKPLYYASSFVQNGFAYGTLVETHMGRPTKIEGNPEHPASLGKSSVFMQAELLSLYDPERGKEILHNAIPSHWSHFYRWISNKSIEWQKTGGMGLRILTEAVTSPSLGRILNQCIARYPEARWYSYEPIQLQRDSVLTGAELAFGQRLSRWYRFDQAKIIVSLDADFLTPEEPGHLFYAKGWADMRRVRSATKRTMSRLYLAETAYSITGAMADHRLSLAPHRFYRIAYWLGKKLGVVKQDLKKYPLELTSDEEAWVSAVAADLKANRGQCILITGVRLPPELHALGYFINEKLGNFGKTIYFIKNPEESPPDLKADSKENLGTLVKEMKAGQVDTLLMLGGNPVYNVPGRFDFKEGLNQVPNRLKSGLAQDETSVLCQWYLPESHSLESWGDARAFNGTYSTIQPMIAPLYSTQTNLEIAAAFSGDFSPLGQKMVRKTWEALVPELARTDFEEQWKMTLQRGFLLNSESPKVDPKVDPSARSQLISQTFENHLKGRIEPPIEVAFYPDSHIWDGRFSNNAWLQELPKPLTQLTWENAALIGPKTANDYHLKTGDMVELEERTLNEKRKVRSPVLIVPGHAENCISLFWGYGRSRCGSVGIERGTDVFPLWNPEISQNRLAHFIYNYNLTKIDETTHLAITQLHSNLEETDVVRFGILQQFLIDPALIAPPEKLQLASFFGPYEPEGLEEAWAMVIDLNVCIGCKACTIACQAENNIPVVGKEQVLNRREMHWIRVDRYFKGQNEHPKILFQPVPCMHCEKAPCEIVCPTQATVHTPSGLNAMIYNRCVGTRFCSNNCPYKVRRFNFLQFSEMEAPLQRLMSNPDVTVRSRGVMEKCTYCIQRIRESQIQADLEKRPIHDGEVMTACQQACPTDAIIFGNKADSRSKVAHLRTEPLHYSMLHEIGTLPRTTYLAKLTNPQGSLA